MTFATAHNGGRSQVNVNFLQSGGAYPFLNCLKGAQQWSWVDNANAPVDPDTLDSDGYPISISHSGVATVFDVPAQTARPGNYVATWDGNGTINFGMPNTLVSGSKSSTTGSGRYVFSTTASRFNFWITAIGSPRISNVRVFHVDDEAALNAGEVFGAKFKQRLAEANFGVIRFLDWQEGSTSNVTTWATRKPLTYAFYAGLEFRGSIYLGLTTNVGNAYSAAKAGFVLADKAMVTIKFNASAAATPCTLNVNGTGDINILNSYSTPLSGPQFPIGGTFQSLATLVYDATLNAWIKHGGDGSLGSQGIGNGVPPELMVRLCAEVGAHPFFVTPRFTIDPATDYMIQLATYCRDNAPSWMVPRFEGPNETWNNAGGFYTTGLAHTKSVAYGWGDDIHNWYGKVMSVLGQAISTVYGGARAKYQVLCGVQTGTGTSPPGSNARLNSAKYVAQVAPAQSPYSKTPASNWVTHITVANYFTPSEYNTPAETTRAADYAAAAGNPTLQSSIATAYATTGNTGTGAFTVDKLITLCANWKGWAQGFGVQKMCCYEGGYSPDYTGGGTSQVDTLRYASKLTTIVGDYTTLNYDHFTALSDGTFTAEFPSCFVMSGRTPSVSIWAVLEDIHQTPDPLQWSAIAAFNGGAVVTPPPVETVPSPDRTVKVKGHNRTVKVAASSRTVKSRG